MPKLQTIRDEELNRNNRHLLDLKSELQQLAAPHTKTPLQSPKEFLNFLTWCQYEGVPVHQGQPYCYVTHCVLLLAAEILEESCSITLGKCEDEFVLIHPDIIGACPLEMLGYRPLHPDEGSWADTELVDKILYSIELIQDSFSIRDKRLTWPEILLGKSWLWLMNHPIHV